MDEFLHLTDGYGDDVFVQKEVVIAFWDDAELYGDPRKIIHGCKLVLSNGGTVFVRERAAQVARQLKGLPE